MLQDELFQEELRHNPEFSHLAGRRGAGARDGRAGAGYPGVGGTRGAPGRGRRRDRRRRRRHRRDRTFSTGCRVIAPRRARPTAAPARLRSPSPRPRRAELGEHARRRLRDGAAGWHEPGPRPPGRCPLLGGGAPAPGGRGGERSGLLARDLDLGEEKVQEADFTGVVDGRNVELKDMGGDGRRVCWADKKKKD